MRSLLSSLIARGFLTYPAHAQQTLVAPLNQVFLEYVVDSGVQPNVAGHAVSVYQTSLEVEGTTWLRIYFGDVELAEGSFLRLTSLFDGDMQELDADGLAMWQNTSAYFNGDCVHVELVAAPDTARNRLRIQRLAHAPLTGPAVAGGPGISGICGDTDDRVPSFEEWTARLLPAGGTAAVIGEDSCMLSAGHAMSGDMVVQFNVPNSTGGCVPVHPPAAEQFPIVEFLFNSNGPGDDWAVMRAGINGLGEKPFERYGVFRPVTLEVAQPGQVVEATGYGMDLTCVRNQIQQFADGTICETLPDRYTFWVDVTFGNSGSALILNDEVIGIVTHGDCCNQATRITNADIQAALDDMCVFESDTTPLPFFDDFEDVLLRPEFWTGVDGADVWISGINEPSGLISMRLDATNPEGGGDEARSAIMDVTTLDTPKLTYWYEQTGEGDSPEAGDDLLVEYVNSSEVWVELNRHLGSGPDMTDFEFVSIVLPAGANHPGFRVRFNALSTEEGEVDTHHVDDVCVGTDADCPDVSTCPWDCQDEPDGAVSVVDFLALLAQWGGPGSCDFDGNGVGITDFLDLLAFWGPCP